MIEEKKQKEIEHKYKDYPLVDEKGGILKLAKPSWDCGWYWGFGYLQSKDIHTHAKLYSAIELKEMLLPRYEKYAWKIIECIFTVYELKDHAEFLIGGHSGITQIPELAEKLKNKEYSDKINTEIIPMVFEELYKMLEECNQ